MLMDCSPEDVFDVLADGWSFATWVVGAARIRDVDADWPAPESSIHHSVGAWPALLDDTTTVREVDRPHSLLLKVRAWPAGEGSVRVTCTPQASGTLVTMAEEATDGPTRFIPKPVRDALLHPRNRESLRRLRFLAESRARGHDDTDGAGDVAVTRPPGA